MQTIQHLGNRLASVKMQLPSNLSLFATGRLSCCDTLTGADSELLNYPMTEEQKAKRRETDRIWRDKNREKLRAGYRKWSLAHPELKKQKDKAYRENHRMEIRERDRQYRLRFPEKMLKSKEERKAQRLRYIKRHPEKHKARQAVLNAVNRGKLIRVDSCNRCGSQEAIEAHHADYSKPLQIEWLCYACHCTEHGRRILHGRKPKQNTKGTI